MRRSGNGGFTLLELLIVVLIMVLVLAISYPSLSRSSSSMHLRTTGRNVLNTFRFAREKAVTEQVGMRITVDREERKLVLADDLGENSRIYPMPDDVEIYRVTLAGREIADGPVVVRFLPNGGSDSAELLLKSKTGSYLRVISDPIAGGARIELGQGESLR
jgi:prepilin-type N-terminal cleavage/methylation domain-containing protein